MERQVPEPVRESVIGKMILLVRVDDRLLHGQIICAWVPYMKADSLIVASDEAAGDSLVSDIIESCGCKGLEVHVKKINEIVDYASSGGESDSRAILIVGDLRDAMRLYEEGMRFRTLNIGNIHHEDDGRKVAPSVILNREDMEIIRRFEAAGVKIDIRDVPASPPAAFDAGKDGRC